MQSPMTRPNRHRIRRQLVELAVGAAEQGPAAHQQLARPFWDRAIPELEQVFDRAAGPDELLRLDRLELDLGAVGGADWPAEFRRKLIMELTRSLAQFTAVSDTNEDGRGDPRPPEAWRQFLFFLAHGRLPWWATAQPRRWNEVLKGSDADWNALRETISSDSRARVRLVYSVDDEFLDRAIARWSGVADAARVLDHLTPTASCRRCATTMAARVLEIAAHLGGHGRLSVGAWWPAARSRSDGLASEVRPGGWAGCIPAVAG